MGRFVGDIETERPVLVLVNEFEGVAIDQMGCVSIFYGFFSAMPPIVFVVIPPVVDVVDIATVVSAEVVEPMVLRMEFGIAFRISQVPFADDSCSVSIFLE